MKVEGEKDDLVLPPLEGLRRCDAPPVFFSFMFAEAITAFKRIDEVEARCAGGKVVAARCVALVFGLIDVSGDGVFSRAELARALRAASFFVGYELAAKELQNAFVPMEKLSIAWLAASLLGPSAAENLIDSYDFDGDGRLSLKELLQDRSPQEGIQGVAAGLARKVPPKVLSGIMKPAVMSGIDKIMKGVFGLLR